MVHRRDMTGRLRPRTVSDDGDTTYQRISRSAKNDR